MDIRRILRQRDKLSDIMIVLDDIMDEDTKPKTDYEMMNLTMLEYAMDCCEEAHKLLEGIYERLLEEEYEEVF